jgi:RHS repeat-associated protein
MMQSSSSTTVPHVCALEYRFTGKERDTESGLDYFGARYYGSSMGRFMSPDPSGLEYADPKNPQSLNLYSYVLNNPLHYVDPTGLYCDYSDHNDPSSGFDSSQFDYNSNSGECGTNGGQWVNDAYTHNGADDANRPQEAVSSLTTAPNTPWTLTDFRAMGDAWLQGVLPQQLNYGPWSWESIDMSHNFAVNRARAAYIKAGCPGSGTSANSFAAGHVEAGVDSWGNVVLGQPDYLELQVGGFSGTITGGGDSATFTVTNPMSNSSFNGQSGITGGHSTDNPNGPNGPKHTVMQTFKWTEESLCHQ